MNKNQVANLKRSMQTILQLTKKQNTIKKELDQVVSKIQKYKELISQIEDLEDRADNLQGSFDEFDAQILAVRQTCAMISGVDPLVMYKIVDGKIVELLPDTPSEVTVDMPGSDSDIDKTENIMASTDTFGPAPDPDDYMSKSENPAPVQKQKDPEPTQEQENPYEPLTRAKEQEMYQNDLNELTRAAYK